MTMIIAHRGARARAPENTLPAFLLALEMGAAGIELDVQCSKDGALIVMHDFTVDRTTDGSGPVAELTLKELQQLDAGSYFGYRYLWTRIPTLEKVLDRVGDRCMVNIEIKSKVVTGGAEVDAVAEIVRRRNLYDQVIVSSFNPMSLIKMRLLDSKIRLGLLYAEPLTTEMEKAWYGSVVWPSSIMQLYGGSASSLEHSMQQSITTPEALHPRYDLVDEVYMEKARQHGKLVNVWTVNDVDEARRLSALGVDAIITDVPDVLLQALCVSDGATV